MLSTSTGTGIQFELFPALGINSAIHGVHVLSAVVVAAFTSMRSIIPLSEVPEHGVTAIQIEVPLVPQEPISQSRHVPATVREASPDARLVPFN